MKNSKYVVSKYVPTYPNSAEREYERLSSSYMKEFNKIIKENLPEVKRICEVSYNEDSRYDAKNNLIEKLCKKMLDDANKRIVNAVFETMVSGIAKKVQKHSLKEWTRVMQKTVGLTPDKGRYNDEFYENIIQNWIKQNKEMAKDIMDSSIEKIKSRIQSGIKKGYTPIQIAKEIQSVMKQTISHAKQASKDQVARLNTSIEKSYCQDSGSDSYMWMTKNDSFVRDCHKSFHGKIYSWDDPPEIWHIGPGNVKIMDGRRCHPGEDYRCRCIALPVFNIPKE